MPDQPTILFVGGGSGGHIYPNLAVLERLEEHGYEVAPHFVVSQRQVDATILDTGELTGTAIPAQPLSLHPKKFLDFYSAYKQCVEQVGGLLETTGAKAMVATGGFVSGPSVAAAKKAGLPVALVSLDAVPGKSNRWSARSASKIFSAYDTPMLSGKSGGAEVVSVPLRRSVLGVATPQEAREALGLEPDTQTLLVFGGSQGGGTINQAFIEIAKRNPAQSPFKGGHWQVLHLAGEQDREAVAEAYELHNIPGKVFGFCGEMGLAWAAASLCVCRSGAGSVAEGWANTVPMLFLPYPFHKDDHQRANALPAVQCGGAMLLQDHADAKQNADELLGPMRGIMPNRSRLDQMRRALEEHQPPDGAEAIAEWVVESLGL